MSSNRGKYRLRARALRQQETRERIVAATVALHAEVGPARTTVAEVARRAGVERLTVYNNFPDPADLLRGCQGHFVAAHPPPDLGPSGPPSRLAARLETALRDLYGWYRANAAMVRNVQHDRHLVPELDRLLRATSDAAQARAAAAYAEGLARTPAQAAAARDLVRLAFAFGTWELLAEGGGDAETARLLRRAVLCVTGA